MTRLVITRVFQAVVTLLGVTIVVFALSHITGNPVDVLLPLEATAEERDAAIATLGLDDPIIEQYGRFLGRAVQGDFGISIRTRQPAIDLVMSRLVASLQLVSAAIVVMLVVSIPLGVLAAVKRNSIWDRMAMTLAVLGQSLPPFFTGVVAILVFSVTFQLLPAQGSSTWKHYIMPAVTMGLFTGAGITRLMRSSMLEVLDSEFVKLARIKGVSERIIIWKHAFRNALIPVVTFIALMYGVLIAAAVTTEVVFAWPGMGRLAFEAVTWKDFPVLQAVVTVWALVIVTINLIVDLSYGWIDPRTRSRAADV